MPVVLFFFFNDTATTEIYTLSLHDALPICRRLRHRVAGLPQLLDVGIVDLAEVVPDGRGRSEEHTSELQSRQYLVCRLLLEKKKKTTRPKHQLPIRQTHDAHRLSTGHHVRL